MHQIIYFQVYFALVFKGLIGCHVLELVYAFYRCSKLRLTWWTTFKWMVNVAFNGGFALRMLHEPEKYYQHGKTN